MSVMCLIVLETAAQTSMTIDDLKYIITAPDGSDAIGVYENSGYNKIQVKTREAFYKYQLLDLQTSEPVLDEKNDGKECEIDKFSINDGTYNLRLYTEDFIITWEVTIKKNSKLYYTGEHLQWVYLKK